MNKFTVAFVIGSVLVNFQLTGASPIRKPLADSEGQLLVERFFAGTEFNTGDWGNDISLLLPFQWLSENNEKFALFSMAEHKRTHEADWFVEQIVDGRLRHCEYKFSPETDIEFLPHELYEVLYSNDKKCLCYHNERMRGSDAETDGVGFIENFTWNELSVSTNGCPQKIIRKGWPEVLFGAAQKESLVARHCRFVTETHKPSTVSAVYVVACDANYDGICDAYVTSDVEKAGGDKYGWNLYLGTVSGFALQNSPIKISAKQTEDLYIEADVVATKDAFFRVDRLQMPAYVIVLSELDGHLESWSYVYHESAVKAFRSKKGFAGADFYSCLNGGKSGVSSIRDLFFSHYTLVNAERLLCETVTVRTSRSINSVGSLDMKGGQ